MAGLYEEPVGPMGALYTNHPIIRQSAAQRMVPKAGPIFPNAMTSWSQFGPALENYAKTNFPIDSPEAVHKAAFDAALGVGPIAAGMTKIQGVSKPDDISSLVDLLKKNDPMRSLVEKQRALHGLRAAMRDPVTGKVYTGWSHQAAIESAPKWKPGMSEVESGVWGRLSHEWDKATPNAGFVDQSGKFIPRDEAERMWGVLTMEDVRDALKKK
jgi:hypothetical protein